MGIAVSGEFVLAALAGCLIICAFAWKRFSEPSYDVTAAAFRDFKDLTVWNLKDSFSLRRAYVIYCLSLIFIYGILAFFGRLIVQLFDKLDVSGLQIGIGTIEFDSWRWPLFLALGIAGFAPLINPLVPAEHWLRRFSHEVVGIPTRLREKAVRLRTLIDGEPSGLPHKTSNWVRTTLGPKLDSSFVLAKNLTAVVDWSYREHVEWSDPEIRRKLNEYERNVRDETEAALQDFQYLTEAKKIPDSLVMNNQERLKELEKRLLGNIRLLEDLRDKFCLIMAVYCEYGSRFSKMTDATLRDSIIRRIVDKRELPATGLPLYWFVVVFILYFLFITVQWHPLISSVPLSHQTAATSATLETLKVFLLAWLPTTGIAAFVSVVYGPHASAGLKNNGITWSTISGAFGAFSVAAIAMALLAFLYSALPAANTSQMWQSLFGTRGWTGALLYYLLLAPVAMISYCFVNFVRAPEKPPETRRIFCLAMAASIFAVLWLGFIVSITAQTACKIGNPLEAVSVWRVLTFYRLNSTELETCFSYYSTLDLIIVPLTVFVSVLGLARRPASEDAGNRNGAAAAILIVASTSGFFLSVGIAPGRAEEVVVGFRTDIPPFSYAAPLSQEMEKKPYLGYLAELCYEIFADSKYDLLAVPINGDNRFEALKMPLPELGGKRVDVLCDAVTIRLDDSERMEAGTFSPIVFVSGVSYLRRSVRTFKDVELGYLSNSTAARVAKEACTVDALRLGSSGKMPHCFTSGKTDCFIERMAGPLKEEPTKSLRGLASTVPSYVLCPKSDHTQLIAWFCSDTGRDKAYFGDREIILGKLATWRATGHACDGFQDPGQSFTYEPYALLISKEASPELFPFVQRRVYELFSHRAGAEALFQKWFPGQTMSETLAWLFSLNGVMDEDQLLSGEKRFLTIVPRN
ncbi:type 2 periplasmic-binding domain-containing protein [Rhizobium laguerreae]|uniref:hypothetical protein n=1 Tax=Rhizobium laguerreae TaxID=1076926 RepID=UPI0028C43B19|nr:hypothetical protein [Rhizobium laguerreae]